MYVFVQHLGTPATKAHDVGVLTLEQCLQRFAGQHGGGWGYVGKAEIQRLCQEGGRIGHHLFTPAPAPERDLAHEADLRRQAREQLRLDCMDE